MRRVVCAGMTVASCIGCGTWQRVGSPGTPPPGVQVARLFDAGTIYDQMGLFVTGAPLPTVSTIRFLAGPSPDSTLAVFALSLANHSLSFRREADEFVAEYHVELEFRREAGAPFQLSSDQQVRVRGFQETLRADESVLFQGILPVPPGVYTATVTIRDRNSPAFARRERTDTVPRLAGPALSLPLPFYDGSGRASLRDRPQILLNPRATLPYGSDTLRFYVEGYGLPAGTRLAARALDQNESVIWQDTLPLVDSAGFAHAVVKVAGSVLPVGRQEFVLGAVGSALETRTPFLVSFSSQWVITNYAEMVDLLRYFDRQDLVGKLKAAPPEQRAQAWREFWSATDPAPLTPENEALDEYLHRVQVANFRFQETGRPGWMTDRGEVYITLGEPDEVMDLSGASAARSGPQSIRWAYTTLRLVLLFQDLTGFGRYELTPGSRADYQQVLARVRRQQ